jgi:hypothetical protein
MKRVIELEDLPAFKNVFSIKVRNGEDGLDNLMCSFKIKDDPLIYLYPILNWLDLKIPLDNFEFFNFYQP